MLKAVLTFSPLDLCERGECGAAAEMAGLRVGEWPENVSQGSLAQAERLLEAGVIASVAGGIQHGGDQADAGRMLSESVRLFGSDPRSLVARGWLTWNLYWNERLDDALAETESLLSADIDTATQFRVLLLRAVIYTRRGLIDTAFSELERIQPIYDSCDQLHKGKFHNQRGRILRLLGETDRAIIDYDCADSFFREVGSARWQAVTANNLAGVYLETEQYVKAHCYAERARDLFRQLGDRAFQAKAWDQTALTYLAEGKREQAELAINEGLALVESGEILSELRETHQKIKNRLPVELRGYEGNIRFSLPKAETDPPRESSTAMTPLDCALLLIQSDPDLAGTLLDLLIFFSARNSDPRHEVECDHVERAVYSFTQASEEEREHDRNRRLIKLVPTSDS